MVNSDMPSTGEEGSAGMRLCVESDEAGTMTEDGSCGALFSGVICAGEQ